MSDFVALFILIAILALMIYGLRSHRATQRANEAKLAELAEQQQRIIESLQIDRAACESQGKALSTQHGLIESLIEKSAALQRSEAAIAGLGAELSRTGEQIRSEIRDVSKELGGIRNLLEAAPYEDPIPFIEKLPESKVLEMARAMAVLRPAVPYPSWRFDADWRDPDLAFRIRQSLWAYFNRRKVAGPLEVDWYHHMKVRLYLGNDLSRQIFIAGCIDPNEFALIDKVLKPGMVFADVGANEGIYSLFASALVGTGGSVWAFEPSPREMQRTTANLELNALQNVHTRVLALADVDGTGRLLVAGYEHEGHNTLGEFVYETPALEEQEVPLRRLDTVAADVGMDRLDFIKLDVEGSELRVLNGARGVLEKFRPFVLFEANDRSLRHQGANREEVIKFLADRSFTLYLFDEHTGIPARADRGCYSDNMLAVPAGRDLPDSVFQVIPSTAAA